VGCRGCSGGSNIGLVRRWLYVTGPFTGNDVEAKRDPGAVGIGGGLVAEVKIGRNGDVRQVLACLQRCSRAGREKKSANLRSAVFAIQRDCFRARHRLDGDKC